ncbi:MAG: hypothetical protein WCJ75_03385 [Desulfomonile sp.]
MTAPHRWCPVAIIPVKQAAGFLRYERQDLTSFPFGDGNGTPTSPVFHVSGTCRLLRAIAMRNYSLLVGGVFLHSSLPV